MRNNESLTKFQTIHNDFENTIKNVMKGGNVNHRNYANLHHNYANLHHK